MCSEPPREADVVEVCVGSAAAAASSHLSFADDEKGVSSGPLSDDVLPVFVMRLSREKRRRTIRFQ